MRLLILDEELLFGEALAALLARRGHSVKECMTSWSIEVLDDDGTIDACLVSHPDDEYKLKILEEARNHFPNLTLVALWSSPDLSTILRSLKAGADGVCLKHDSIDEIENVLLQSVRGRANGGAFGPTWSRAAQAIVRQRRPARTATTITEKERCVLDLLIAGASTAAMAEDLGVGEATVRTHLQHLFSKFGVHSRLALMAQAVRQNAIELDGPHDFAVAGQHP